MYIMGKTKNKKKNKKKFSRKNVKMKGGIKIDGIIILILSVLIFGIIFILQCYVLNLTFKIQKSIPGMHVLHNYFLLIKTFCVFLDKYFPNNNFTQILYACIKYVITKIPNAKIQYAIQNMIPSIYQRPNIHKQIINFLPNIITNQELLNAIIRTSKGSEEISEFIRIFGVDIGAIINTTKYDSNTLMVNDSLASRFNNAVTSAHTSVITGDFTSLLHLAINYESKFNEVIAYINHLLIAVYSRDPENFAKWFSSLKPTRILENVMETLEPLVENNINNIQPENVVVIRNYINYIYKLLLKNQELLFSSIIT